MLINQNLRYYTYTYTQLQKNLVYNRLQLASFVGKHELYSMEVNSAQQSLVARQQNTTKFIFEAVDDSL